jgi:thiol-disulfide isomerase/thioredoxin
MKKVTIVLFLMISHVFSAQTISGNLAMLSNQDLILDGFNGFSTYSIAKTIIDEKGNFQLSYKNSDYGMGYLMSSDNQAFFVILNGEDIEITGSAFSLPESIKILKGKENALFEKYAKEQPKREQALSAWVYLDKLYANDPIFKENKTASKNIQKEYKNLKKSDALFLSKLPKESFVNWFLPLRKLVSAVSIVAKYRPSEITETIAAFRNLDYTDHRLYKSGLLKDAIEGHFWLIENSGKTPDTMVQEMKLSIDMMIDGLIKDQKKLNEITNFLFDLLERHSLFQASEYLALRVLNERGCSLESDLAKQLESYRAMKKGNVAPEINFGNSSFLNGVRQNQFTNLSSLNTEYTLVVFGASWCPKCQEDFPRLIENYSKWRNLGVEIVYISLDTDQSVFEEKVKEYPFFAYCDYKKWESTPASDYYVSGTPTFYLLNKKREILVRPISIEQIDSWVDFYISGSEKK